jgi:hypothetical protein
VYDRIRRLFRLMRRSREGRLGGYDLRVVDERLGVLEQKQREITARLRLLERQTDPREIRQHG